MAAPTRTGSRVPFARFVTDARRLGGLAVLTFAFAVWNFRLGPFAALTATAESSPTTSHVVFDVTPLADAHAAEAARVAWRTDGLALYERALAADLVFLALHGLLLTALVLRLRRLVAPTARWLDAAALLPIAAAVADVVEDVAIWSLLHTETSVATGSLAPFLAATTTLKLALLPPTFGVVALGGVAWLATRIVGKRRGYRASSSQPATISASSP